MWQCGVVWYGVIARVVDVSFQQGAVLCRDLYKSVSCHGSYLVNSINVVADSVGTSVTACSRPTTRTSSYSLYNLTPTVLFHHHPPVL